MCRIDDGRPRPARGEWRTTDDGGRFIAVFRLSSFVLILLVMSACAPKGSFQSMAQQPRFEPLENDDAAPDRSSSRAAPADTVARGQLRDDTLLYTGKVNGADADMFPYAVTRDVMERGQQRYNIYCAPCHDQTGTGNGMIVRAGFTRPPSLHDERLRAAPVGRFFDVITNGFGPMPPYAEQIAPRDRWAIIAYIRALQLSQHAPIGDVPPDQRDKLGAPAR